MRRRRVATHLTMTTLLLGLVPTQGLALSDAAVFVAPTCETQAAAFVRPGLMPSAERHKRAGFESSKGPSMTGHAVSAGPDLSRPGLAWHPRHPRLELNESYLGHASAQLNPSVGSWWKGASTTTRVWTIVGIVVGVGTIAAAMNTD